jgi:ribosomal protein S18 acetylase RimI-like enzyme
VAGPGSDAVRGLGGGRAGAAGREHGATRAELSTDSRTGALGLYERVGMRVRQTFVHYARELDTAGD